MRSDLQAERGIAIIAALFMVLVVSVMTSSLMYVARTETLSSLNYKTMSQGRYGAESGVHKAANYLLNTYTAPASMAGFDITVTPVTYNGGPVVLSSDSDTTANYPDAAVASAFTAAAQGTLAMLDERVSYTAYARLLSMRQVPNAYGNTLTTIQTWEITGIGRTVGEGSAAVEVSAVIDRQLVPAYDYAAFATYGGCDALSFGGGATTDSYDSRVGTSPADSAEETDGDIGTNGNLRAFGSSTTINGTLATPRAGVGNCTANNTTAATISGNAEVTEGLVELPQSVQFPTPDAPNPTPPTDTSVGFSGASCPSVSGSGGACSGVANGFQFGPSGTDPVVLGNVSVGAGKELHLTAGTYIFNSLNVDGNARIIVDNGPVVIQIAGKNNNGTDMALPVDLTGGADLLTPNYDAAALQFIYAGAGELRMRGGAEAAMVVYAPNATVDLSGSSDYYGAIIGKTVEADGLAAIHYDRALAQDPDLTTPGQHTMSSFTWKAF